MMDSKKNPNCPVIEIANLPKVLYHVHYASAYLGVVFASSQSSAIRAAKSKFGTHIIKNMDHLAVSRGEGIEG